MPFTSSVPDVGCCRSAITRSIVVLPQPEGPMKETKSPSATCRLTLESASTRPSAVSKVREIFWASTTRRLVEARSEALTELAPDVVRPGGGDAFLSPTIEIFDLAVAITGVCQKLLTVARPMFEHAERIISRILLHLHAKAALLWQAAFDLHALRTIVLHTRLRSGLRTDP